MEEEPEEEPEETTEDTTEDTEAEQDEEEMDVGTDEEDQETAKVGDFPFLISSSSRVTKTFRSGPVSTV